MTKQSPAMKELLDAAREARDWLLDAPAGTDQFERGERLAKAISRISVERDWYPLDPPAAA